MPPLGTFRKKTCAKCFKCLKVHLTCSKCDAVYHAKCLLKVPGFHMDQNGHAFCCRNITFKSDPDKEILVSQEKVVTVKREEEYDSDKDLENCLPDEDGTKGNKFKCEACYLEFTNEEHLERHYRECPYIMQGEPIQEINTDGLVCPFCNEDNIQEDSYKEHIKQCEEHHSRSNKVNDVSITIMTEKQAHVHSHKQLFKCNKCNYATKRRLFLINHIVLNHYDGKKRSTHIEYTLERHLRIHTNQKSFKCNQCDYRSALKGSLKTHMKLKHSNAEKDAAHSKAHLRSHVVGKHCNREKKYKCGDCKYRTNGKSNLVMHIRSHTNEMPFKCDICVYASNSEGQLNDHILTNHFNVEKKYKCIDCKFSAHLQASLVEHMRIHTDERPFKCDTCDFATTRMSSLNSHVSVKHMNAEKKYKCSYCKYSAHHKSNLVRHIGTHTDHSNAEKKYKCTDCNYSTRYSWSLVKHTRTHTKGKAFKCDSCDYSGAQRSSLNFHISAKHSNAEKKYKCSDCKYSTYQKSDLVVHLRVHSNERPFKCDICNYAATRNTHLNSHISRIHSNVV